ncbi:Hypothetical predicted protein [Olea europaea subsp. europaea]|uniref:Uncharacterized protein n=1 Tax=Olea europaea subsp. europaea TaxID=158383 RepID=A0A8S0VLV0_OLEEU|nr:Hypothetical predicted protein [Olea europaea subsp. europaea]
METFLEFTNPVIPSDGNPSHFTPFVNVGAPYVEMLSLPRLTVGLPVWLFSTSLVLTVSPSSPISMSSSSTLLGESLDSSNQVAKKKKKSPKILEVWSHNPSCPSSSSKAHGNATLSTCNGKEKGKIRIPCRLCEGNHPLHLCPLMDKASIVLESITAPSPQLPIGYQRLSAAVDCPLVDKDIDSNSSLVQAPLPEPGCAKPIPDQPLVGKSVNLSSPHVDHSVSEEHHPHILLISLDSPEFKNDSPIPAAPEVPPSIPLEHGVNHTIPPPSSLVTSFDWNHLIASHFPSSVPFQITVHAYAKAVPGIVLDEGASVSLIPYTTWQDLGFP